MKYIQLINFEIKSSRHGMEWWQLLMLCKICYHFNCIVIEKTEVHAWSYVCYYSCKFEAWQKPNSSSENHHKVMLMPLTIFSLAKGQRWQALYDNQNLAMWNLGTSSGNIHGSCLLHPSVFMYPINCKTKRITKLSFFKREVSETWTKSSFLDFCWSACLATSAHI